MIDQKENIELGVQMLSFKVVVLFLKFYLLFLERGEEWEKETERNTKVWVPLARPRLGTWPAIQACALTGNQTSDPLVCRLALNPLSHTSQGFRS